MEYAMEWRTLYFAKDKAKNKYEDFMDIMKSCNKTNFVVQEVDEDENHWIMHGVSNAVCEQRESK